MKKYIIITPAYNEAKYIEDTIKSVLKQTVLPSKWMIVDDGSTDKTGEIIQRYQNQYDIIQYYHRDKPKGQAYYASNVYAIHEGVKQVHSQDHDFIAILDADITLPADYYETVLSEFSQDEQLGIASGVYENLINGKIVKVLNDRRSTPKAIMIFRKEVFQQIGGFFPLKFGGEDTIACVQARMLGWKAWSFPDIKVIHNRPTGSGLVNDVFRIRFRQGICEFHLAAHPLFMCLKSIRRCFLEEPLMLGGILRLSGYLWAFLRGDKIELPDNIIKHVRNEQMGRIFNFNKISDHG